MNKAYRFALRNASWLKWWIGASWLLLLAGVALKWWAFPRNPVTLVVGSVLAIVAASLWARWQRDRLVREQPLPHFLKRKLREAYPHLSQKDADLVERGLRQFFMACNRAKGRFVAMPSRVVDSMWHEFILHTQAYRAWCLLVLGRFLDHTPAEALGSQATHNDGLRRAWFWCCKDESINPRTPTRLPLLFALDSKLAIANGFQYVPDCHSVAAAAGIVHCGSDFADGSYSGDAGGFGGEASSSSSDGGGDGDGGGGDGCGGGGCGGGGGD